MVHGDRQVHLIMNQIKHRTHFQHQIIEAKLSIICVRNKVSFNLDDDKKEPEVDKKDPLLFSLDNNNDGDSAPAWIKAVRATAKEMN